MNWLLAKFFEFATDDTTFIDFLYEQNVYLIVGVFMFILALILNLLFYRLIDSVRFSNRLSWFLLFLLNLFFQFFLGFIITYRFIDFAPYSFLIGSKNLILSIPTYIILSIVFRYTSTNNRHNPF